MIDHCSGVSETKIREVDNFLAVQMHSTWKFQKQKSDNE